MPQPAISIEATASITEQIIESLNLVNILLPSERAIRRLFWRDDMENYTTIKWTSYLGPTVPTYVNNVIAAFEGDYVLRLVAAGTGGSVYINFGALIPNKHEYEVRWWHHAGINQNYIIMDNRAMRGSISYYPVPNIWRYIPSFGGAEIDIAGSTEAIRNDTWNYLKVEVDWGAGAITRLVTNLLDLTVNLPVYAFPIDAGISQVVLGANGTAPLTAYFDDFRIYLNLE